MKQLVRWLVILILALVAVLAINTWRLPAPPEFTGDAANLAALPEQALAARLAGALRLETLSKDAAEQPHAEDFAAFDRYLETLYPRVHAQLRLRRFNQHSRLYRWAGRDAERPGLLLLAHSDVVPVEPGTEARWQYPPFDGVIADGYIWGRGALDDKSSVLGWMEALEYLLEQGFEPEADIWLAIGHDEEVGGRFGAVAMAEWLREQGVQVGLALDEGGAITQGIVPGVQRPVASIMAGEKGYVSIELMARGSGGHSSTPPATSAIGRLGAAVGRLQTQQMPRRLQAPVTDMLERIAGDLPLSARVAIANRWLLEPMLLSSFGKSRVGNALLRTTTAPTLIHGGIKDNVIATEARAVINFRILPGDTVADVEAHVRAVVNDPEITIRRYSPFVSEPSPVSDLDSPEYAQLATAVKDVFPDALISTGVVTGATDLRHYHGLYRHRFNFVPLTYLSDDVERFHGSNERVGVADYRKMVQCYIRILQRSVGR